MARSKKGATTNKSGGTRTGTRTRSGKKTATPPHVPTHERTRGGVSEHTEQGAVGGRGIAAQDGTFTR